MTQKQQQSLQKLTMVYQQFGVVLVQCSETTALFHAAKNAPLETRHVELMAKEFKNKTGLKFKLQPVEIKLN